jgi:hypothetical protein
LPIQVQGRQVASVQIQILDTPLPSIDDHETFAILKRIQQPKELTRTAAGPSEGPPGLPRRGDEMDPIRRRIHDGEGSRSHMDAGWIHPVGFVDLPKLRYDTLGFPEKGFPRARHDLDAVPYFDRSGPPGSRITRE